MRGEEVGGRLRLPPTRFEEPRREVVVERETLSAMLKLRELGWGSKRIARELGVSRGTVKRYLEAGGWRKFRTPERKKVLDAREDWLRERLNTQLRVSPDRGQ